MVPSRSVRSASLVRHLLPSDSALAASLKNVSMSSSEMTVSASVVRMPAFHKLSTISGTPFCSAHCATGPDAGARGAKTSRGVWNVPCSAPGVIG